MRESEMTNEYELESQTLVGESPNTNVQRFLYILSQKSCNQIIAIQKKKWN